MRKGFNLLLLLLCFTLSGCTTNHETKDVGPELIPISDKIIEKLSTTKSIIVKIDYTGDIKKIITDENQIKEIIDIISHSTKHIGDVNYIGASYDLEMYDKDGKLVDIIETFDTNISIISTNNRYDLDVNDLVKIIEN
jgi:hypothetical protein